MLRDRQFSLRWLLLEVFWIALAAGLIRGVTEPDPVVSLLFLLSATAFIGAAVGGVFGSRDDGVTWALFLGAFASQILPDL